MDFFASYSGKSHLGYQQKSQDDYIRITMLDEDALIALIADGARSKDENREFTPAPLVANQVLATLQRLYINHKEILLKNRRLFMEEAFLQANNVLAGFKLANEEKYYDLATTLTCVFLTRDGVMTFGHVGNTRLYLIHSNGKQIQLTKDHTSGQVLIDKGLLAPEDYYSAPERLTLTNGLGIMADPPIQTYQIQLKKDDLLIMTSDGIHYSFKDSAFYDIVTSTNTLDDAVDMMIQTALDLKDYRDNISASIIWYQVDPVKTDAAKNVRSAKRKQGPLK